MARNRVFRLPVVRGVDRARRVARDRLPRARDLGQLRGAGADATRPSEVKTEITRGQIIFSFAIAIGFALMLFKVDAGADHELAADRRRRARSSSSRA